MRILSREMISMTSEGVRVEHEGAEYYVVRRLDQVEVVKPDGSTLRRTTKLAKAFVAFTQPKQGE